MDQIEHKQKLEGLENVCREILSAVKKDRENLSAFRVSALKRIEEGVQMIDNLSELIETEIITIEPISSAKIMGKVHNLFPTDDWQNQETEHNRDLESVIETLKTIRNTLMGV